MPTVLDSLTVELGWDVKKFLEGAKETEARVKATREDFERTSKVWDATIGALIRQLSGLVAAFLSVEAAIKGIEWTKGASAAGAEFSSFASAVGMSVTQLGEWEQALVRVGGAAGEARAAFGFQQEEFMKARGPKGGAPVFLDWLQRLGLNAESYYDPTKKSYDLDKFNRDLFEKIQTKSAAERQQILQAFGFSGTAAQALAAKPIGPQLEQQRASAMTKENEETFRRLHALWSDLGNTAEAVYRDLTTYLEVPLTRILKAMQSVFGDLLAWQRVGGPKTGEDWVKYMLGLPPPPPGPDTSIAGQYLRGRGLPPGAAAPRVSPRDVPLTAPTPGPGESFTDRYLRGRGLPPGAPASPVVPGLSAPSPGISSSGGGALMPIVPPAPAPPATFDERFAPATGAGPRSSIDLSRSYSFFDLPRSARAFAAAETRGSVSTTSSSNVTIGAMSFNSRSSDTAMGHAPSDVSKDLSVASYSVHANEALE